MHDMAERTVPCARSAARLTAWRLPWCRATQARDVNEQEATYDFAVYKTSLEDKAMQHAEMTMQGNNLDKQEAMEHMKDELGLKQPPLLKWCGQIKMDNGAPPPLGRPCRRKSNCRLMPCVFWRRVEDAEGETFDAECAREAGWAEDAEMAGGE